VRKRNAGRAWWGDLRIEPRGGRVTIDALVPANSPAHAAGLDRDDELRQMDGSRIRSAEDVSAVVGRHRPGDRVVVMYVDRTGREKTTSVMLGEDPHVEVVPIESSGGSLTSAERSFREKWLSAR
jgi:S1-C subfamily serine protease